jgi:cell division protein FtsQ
MQSLSNTSSPTTAMEPRIRVRRAQVRRQEGRRRLRVLVALLTVAGGAGAGWAATRSPLLDIDHVVVDGASHTGTGTAARAIGVDPGQPMLDVDGGAVARRLRALPWVRSVSVRKDWPGTLRVELVERSAVAVTPNVSGGWALVDGSGRVLSWSAAPPPGTLVVAGFPPAGAPGSTLPLAADGLLAVVQGLPVGLRPKVTTVVVDPAGINLGLATGGTVRLGAPEDLAEKLRAAAMVLDGVDTTDLAVLDVRLPATPTVTRTHP